MKKLLLKLIICLIVTASLAVNVYATDISNADNLQSNIMGELADAIDYDTARVLEEIGLSDLSLDEIYNISFDNISSFFAETLKEKASDVARDFTELFCVIMFMGIISAMLNQGSDNKAFEILNIVIITILAVDVIKDSLGAVVSVLNLSGKFMLGFAPVYTFIISLSGNTATALTYNTFAMLFAEVISSLISTHLVDIIGVFFCLGISFSINESINIGRFTNGVNRVVTTLLGFVASGFTGFLSLKNILSVSVDRVSVRSIRFLISSLIPVVGSSISDAYSSLLGSINLIKSSVALVGILVTVIINTPIIVETLIYYISFNLLGYLSESLSLGRAGDIFRVFSCGVRILLLLCIFEMFIMIITTGIVLSARNGG